MNKWNNPWWQWLCLWYDDEVYTPTHTVSHCQCHTQNQHLFSRFALLQSSLTASSVRSACLFSDTSSILLLRFPTFILLRFVFTMLFCTEKPLSQGTEVSGTTSEMLARMAKSGNSSDFSLMSLVQSCCRSSSQRSLNLQTTFSFAFGAADVESGRVELPSWSSRTHRDDPSFFFEVDAADDGFGAGVFCSRITSPRSAFFLVDRVVTCVKNLRRDIFDDLMPTAHARRTQGKLLFFLRHFVVCFGFDVKSDTRSKEVFFFYLLSIRDQQIDHSAAFTVWDIGEKCRSTVTHAR